jgi:hypothetical protein
MRHSVRAHASFSNIRRALTSHAHRGLEAENAKLKRMYADLALENAAIQEVLTRKL